MKVRVLRKYEDPVLVWFPNALEGSLLNGFHGFDQQRGAALEFIRWRDRHGRERECHRLFFKAGEQVVSRRDDGAFREVDRAQAIRKPDLEASGGMADNVVSNLPGQLKNCRHTRFIGQIKNSGSKKWEKVGTGHSF